MIELIHVTRQFPHQRGLFDFSLKVEPGQWVVVTGATGAGKSTLLRMVYGEERPDEGEVMVDELQLSALKPRHLPKLRRKLGIVDQELHLIPERTVLANVTLVGEVFGWPRRKRKLAALRALNQVGLHGHLTRKPDTLSLGEQRRLAIARALVAEPFALIADEPLGNLDPDTARGIVQLLADIHLRGTSILLTTHQIEYFRGRQAQVVHIEHGHLARSLPMAELEPSAGEVIP